MDSIDSDERIGPVSVSNGQPPSHSEKGHERCAYYLDGDSDSSMRCPHDETARGAFYNEDYVRELKQLVQRFVERMQGQLDAGTTVAWHGMHESFKGAAPIGVIFDWYEDGQHKNVIDMLRELAK